MKAKLCNDSAEVSVSLIRCDGVFAVIVPMLIVGECCVEFLSFVLPKTMIVIIEGGNVVEGFRFGWPAEMVEEHHISLTMGDVAVKEGVVLSVVKEVHSYDFDVGIGRVDIRGFLSVVVYLLIGNKRTLRWVTLGRESWTLVGDTR